MSEPFKCDKCSACCRLIFFVINQAQKEQNQDDEIAQLVREFPYEVAEDGSCSMLDENGLCKVYEDRPLICRVDDLYDKFYADKMSKEEFNQVTLQACDHLKLVIINGAKEEPIKQT